MINIFKTIIKKITKEILKRKKQGNRKLKVAHALMAYICVLSVNGG